MTMNDGVRSIVIELRFKYVNDNGNEEKFLTFKIDGQRFKTSTKTIKFCTESKYEITVVTRPTVQLEFMVVSGVHLQFASSTKEGHYQTEWSTAGIKPSTKGSREDVLVSFQGPSICVTSGFQCKFYKPFDVHAQWGNRLEYILLKCSHDNVTNSVQILDQEFR